jgi:hypothetical protein
VKVGRATPILKITAALYCRLSRDDEIGGDSSSIQTQKAMLSRYAQENGYDNFAFYVEIITPRLIQLHFRCSNIQAALNRSNKGLSRYLAIVEALIFYAVFRCCGVARRFASNPQSGNAHPLAA